MEIAIDLDWKGDRLMPATLYHLTTKKSVETTIADLERALAARQFGVLWHLDLNQKLVEKGLEPEPPFHVLEVCSASRAKQALQMNQTSGYFLPCKMVVYQDRESGATTIGFPEPEVLLGLVGSKALIPLAVEVANAIREAAKEASI